MVEIIQDTKGTSEETLDLPLVDLSGFSIMSLYLSALSPKLRKELMAYAKGQSE